MLFNSLAFCLLALPAVLLAHEGALRFVPTLRPIVLLLVSFAFYASFAPRFLPLLVATIGANWAVGRLLTGRRSLAILAGAIAANLAVLAGFKYLGFLADLLSLLPETPRWEVAVAFPLGISFFTFQHIMYLREVRAGRVAPMGLVDYALYVSFFPRVVAGPLVRPAEWAGQLDPARLLPPVAERYGPGLLLFVAGLAKKVAIGDPLGALADPVFAAASAGATVTVADAWGATLAYTFQLYFDFSGYSDMAIGLSLLFGVRLPFNFDAPYRAASIGEFWRRWHMTLSRFLRDFIYIPIGGNRHGLPRQIGGLLATMALGGLWHGAGLTFVAWGFAHGAALAMAVIWARSGARLPRPVGIAATFAFVAAAWVLFRAHDFASALVIYRSLLGFAPGGDWFDLRLVAVAAAFAFLGPNSQDLVRRLPPTRAVAVGGALLLAVLLVLVGDDANRDFVYARF